MSDLQSRIIAAAADPNYHPVKPKALMRKLELPSSENDAFKTALKELIREGRIEIGKGNAVRPVGQHGTLTGIFRKAEAGFGSSGPIPMKGTVHRSLHPGRSRPRCHHRRQCPGPPAAIAPETRTRAQRRNRSSPPAGDQPIRRHLLHARRPVLCPRRWHRLQQLMLLLIVTNTLGNRHVGIRCCLHNGARGSLPRF